MLLLVSVPYFIGLLGICLGYVGVRPAMLAWATCMLGAFSGLVIAIGILASEQPTSWIFVVVAGMPFAIAALMTIKDLSYPLINDVTTDVDHPPTFVVALDNPTNAVRDMAFPERFGPIVRKAYPKVLPLLLDEPPQQIFQRVSDFLKEKPGWLVTHCNEDKGILEVEVTTSFLGFVDDVVIRVVDQAGGTRVDMRSKSREGLVDGGYNAIRIQTFLEQFKICWD